MYVRTYVGIPSSIDIAMMDGAESESIESNHRLDKRKVNMCSDQ